MTGPLAGEGVAPGSGVAEAGEAAGVDARARGAAVAALLGAARRTSERRDAPTAIVGGDSTTRAASRPPL